MEWDADQATQWLKALSLYDCIPQEYDQYTFF